LILLHILYIFEATFSHWFLTMAAKEDPMKLKNIFLSLLFIAISLTLVAGDTINGAGATFPYPVYSAWAFN